MTSRFLAFVLAASGLLGTNISAHAIAITIGLSESGSADATFGPGPDANPTAFGIFNQTYGTFDINSISGQAFANPLNLNFGSTSINLSSTESGPNTLIVYVTASGITGPLGNIPF